MFMQGRFTASAVRTTRRTTYRRRSRRLGTIIVDSKGTVRLCTGFLCDILGVGRNQLIGQPAQAFLPGLPIRPATPGYNVAYAAFVAASKSKQALSLRCTDGSTFPVLGSFSVFKIQNEVAFVLDLESLHADGHGTRGREEIHRNGTPHKPASMRAGACAGA